MIEYTPTTEEVRTDYMHRWMRWESGLEFDRWLAQHDAEVRADERVRIIRGGAE